MKKNILVLDDEINIGLLLKNFLSRQYEVKYFSKGEEALQSLEQQLPDLIICDIQMPGVDGYAFLSTIRERGYTSQIPVIMLSAKSQSRERIKSYRLGAQDYLTKPFNPEELEELIRKNLYPIYHPVV